ncbi:MAG: host attachment protein [Hyphomicrobiaceae bacterium]|nr:host attachment protein [Hyphomicrobiaceae bacterium]
MKPTRTWIVIADSGRAHVLENLGPGKGARRIEGFDLEAKLPPTHDIVADRQARSFESFGSGRHPIEPKTDPREQLKEEFLARLAARLDERLAAGAFDRAILVAPPHALGILRGAMSPKVKAAVTGELAKDLTKTPDHELGTHLEDLIRI